ncbi:hypothetical protein EB796_000169 [Bugula neritina]|uniref:Uncharacterized protein n=1 Tax=Bugula neritina TaxID=10212 RepID=A0A7J7KTK4_BUGNE|nr:hypothetical protein EB796_000169 [Bugula neritina]
MATLKESNHLLKCKICSITVGDGLREAKVLPCKSCYCLPCLIKHCSSQPSDAMHEQVPAREPPLQADSISTTVSHLSVTMDSDVSMLMTSDVRHVTDEEDVPECPIHRGVVFDKGCKWCYAPLCEQCITNPGHCPKRAPAGNQHVSDSLDSLMETIRRKLDSLSFDVDSKRENLSVLRDECKAARDKYNRGTEVYQQMIETAKVDQTLEILAKYMDFEQILTASRKNEMQKLDEFQEGLTKKMMTLVENVETVRSGLQTQQQAKVLVRYQETRKLVDSFSSLTLEDTTAMPVNPSRDIEIEKNEAVRLCLREKVALKRLPKPISINHLPSVYLSKKVKCVHRYFQDTYLGHEKGVIKVSENNDVIDDFIVTKMIVMSVSVEMDRLYTLEGDRASYFVRVYNMAGEFLNEWQHHDKKSDTSNKLVVVDGKVIVTNREQARLDIYQGADGRQLPSVPCGILRKSGTTSICSPDSETVIVAVCNSGMCRIDLSRGEAGEWSNGYKAALSMTCYGRDFLLVAGRSSSKVELTIINANTGAVEGKLNCGETERTKFVIPDLYTDGNTLAVSRSFNEQLLFYSFNS